MIVIQIYLSRLYRFIPIFEIIIKEHKSYGYEYGFDSNIANKERIFRDQIIYMGVFYCFLNDSFADNCNGYSPKLPGSHGQSGI